MERVTAFDYFKRGWLADNRAAAATGSQDAAVAAIHFSLDDEDGLDFLSYWNEGEFDVIRRNWPGVPEAVFIGADPLHPETLRPTSVEPGRHEAELEHLQGAYRLLDDEKSALMLERDRLAAKVAELSGSTSG